MSCKEDEHPWVSVNQWHPAKYSLKTRNAGITTHRNVRTRRITKSAQQGLLGQVNSVASSRGKQELSVSKVRVRVLLLSVWKSLHGAAPP
jgi:hypothetical protein